jgi:dihydrofolate reductase
VGKLIESTHVALGGEISSPRDWAAPFLDEEHTAYANRLLFDADALLLGRRTYEGLSAGYTAMPSDPFVDRMNAIPKFVASNTLRAATWNSTIIEGDVAKFVGELKQHSGGNLLKYGNGELDVPLMEHGLIDEFHLLLTPVANGNGQHLFEGVAGSPRLNLDRVTTFKSGVVLLVYAPRPS